MGEIDGMCIIVVVRPGTLVELPIPPRGGEIVVVGATVGFPGLTGDDDMAKIGAAVGADTWTRVAIEKDIEKLEDFDPSTAAEKKRKKLQFPRNTGVRNKQGGRIGLLQKFVCLARTIWLLPPQVRQIFAHFHRICYLCEGPLRCERVGDAQRLHGKPEEVKEQRFGDLSLLL